MIGDSRGVRMTSNSPRFSFRPSNSLRLLTLVAAVFLAFWPALRSGFIWDDDRYIENNVQLRSLVGLSHVWTQIGSTDQYYPVTFTTFWIEHHLWQAHPLGYHLDNLLLHLAGAILLWQILLRLEIPGAFFAALLFAVHPIQVESVLWATERKNILSGFFYFLSLFAYLRTRWGERLVASSIQSPSSHWLWYAASLLLFFAALLSKSVTSTLPAVVLLLIWWKHGRIRWADFLPLIPMFVVGAAMGALTAWIERTHVGAVGPLFDFTPLERLCIAGRAAWFYALKLAWPVPLIFIYPRWQYHVSHQYWLLLFPLLVFAVLLPLWLARRRITRGPLTAVLFFLGTLVPALGFTNVFPMRYSFVADHFQYLACIGPLSLIASLVSRKTYGSIALSFVVACFCFLSMSQSLIYHDRLALWQDTLAKNPDSWMAHTNLGRVYLAQGDFDQAESQFRRSIELNPDEPSNYLQIGICSVSRGNLNHALDWYSQALAHSPPSPYPIINRMRAEPYYRIGLTYRAMAATNPSHSPLAWRDRRQAVDNFQQAIDIIPEYELAHDELGMIFLVEDRVPEAIDQFHQAIDANHDSLIAHEYLGNAYLQQKDYVNAVAQFQQMLRIQPNHATALNNIGVILARQGHYAAAIPYFQSALQADPDFEEAQRNLRAAQIMRSRGN